MKEEISTLKGILTIKTSFISKTPEKPPSCTQFLGATSVFHTFVKGTQPGFESEQGCLQDEIKFVFCILQNKKNFFRVDKIITQGYVSPIFLDDKI